MKTILALLGCFLISIAYEWFLPSWAGYDIAKLSIICVLAFILYSRIDYDELMLKSVSFIVFIDAVWNAVQFLMNGAWQGPLELINAVIFIPWLLYASTRKYEIHSDDIHYCEVAIIAKRPNSFITFIAAMFYLPFGRYSIYVKGHVYHYHHDILKETYVDNFNLDGAVVINSPIDDSTELEKKLKQEIGRKWSFKSNCLTLIRIVKNV